MSKTIFNKDVISNQASQTIDNLTVNDSLILNGAPANQLLITDTGGKVTVFPNAPANYTLIIDSNTLTPAWTNDVILQNVTTNTITIPGTTTGDLLVTDDTNGTIDRLPIGTSGQVLTVGDVGRPEWQDIVFPNPLTLNNLIITTNLKLYGGQGSIFVDGSSNVYTERHQIYNDGGLINYSTTAGTISQYLSWNTVAGRRYKLSVNFSNGNTYPTNYSIISMRYDTSAVKTSYSIGPSDIIHYEYIFTETVTGTHSSDLLAQTSAGTSTAANFTWSMLSLGI
jgi:hypothetical protein